MGSTYEEKNIFRIGNKNRLKKIQFSSPFDDFGPLKYISQYATTSEKLYFAYSQVIGPGDLTLGWPGGPGDLGPRDLTLATFQGDQKVTNCGLEAVYLGVKHVQCTISKSQFRIW